MAELASKEEKWITAILPGAQKVTPMDYFSSPDMMWLYDGKIEMEIPTPENTRVILIPPPDRCRSYAGIYSRHKDGKFNDLFYKAQQSNVITFPSIGVERFKNILREYQKWPYIVDYEIPDEIEELPIFGRQEEKKPEEKVEEESQKTEETVEQPEIESTTDAGSEGSTSWTHKVSGFLKQLFNKK